MPSIDRRELPAAPVSHSAGTGSFDSANTSLREVFAALRMTLCMSSCSCAMWGRELRRLPNTCHPEGVGSLASRAIRNRRIYAFGGLYPVWVRSYPQWVQSPAAHVSPLLRDVGRASPQNHPVFLCALCGKDFDPSFPIRSLSSRRPYLFSIRETPCQAP